MTGLPAEGSGRQDILRQVVEGMAVYDRDQKRVGKVADVFFGAGDDAADFNSPTPPPDADQGADAPLGGFGRAFVDDDIPGTLRARLLRQGYIRIDSAGIFTADRYATADQIASVGEDRVVLTVTGDELMER